MTPEERTAFLSEHRLAIVGAVRVDAPPQLSPVYYVMDGAVDVMMAIGGAMTGNPLPDSARPAIEERAKREGRVVLRVTPESFFP